jgi:hypothetical protein
MAVLSGNNNVIFFGRSFIPEAMEMASVDTRLDEILKTDWKSKAAKLLAEHRANGRGPVRLPHIHNHRLDTSDLRFSDIYSLNTL